MKGICLLIILGCCIGLQAQIVTDRPSQSYGPFVLPASSFQQESSVNYSQNLGFAHGVFFGPVNFFRLGLGKQLELRAANGLTFQKLGKDILVGFVPFRLGLKAQLTKNEDRKTQVGILIQGIFATGLNSGYNGYNGGEIILSFRHQLNPRHSLLYNGAYQGAWIGPKTNAYFLQHAHVTLCYGFQVTDRLSLFAETYGVVDDLPYLTSERYQWNADLGLIYILRPNFQIDYSFGFGFLDLNNFHEIGLSYYIPSKNPGNGNP
jgi:hypothetical protein